MTLTLGPSRYYNTATCLSQTELDAINAYILKICQTIPAIAIVADEVHKHHCTLFLSAGLVRQMIHQYYHLDMPDTLVAEHCDLDVYLECEKPVHEKIVIALKKKLKNTPIISKIDIIHCQDVSNYNQQTDFRMNSVIFNFSEGQIVDNFDGVEDIKAQQIRIRTKLFFVINTGSIIRLFRFATQLGYHYDPEIMDLGKQYGKILFRQPFRQLYKHIGEFFKILTFPTVPYWCEMNDCELYSNLIPELIIPQHVHFPDRSGDTFLDYNVDLLTHTNHLQDLLPAKVWQFLSAKDQISLQTKKHNRLFVYATIFNPLGFLRLSCLFFQLISAYQAMDGGGLTRAEAFAELLPKTLDSIKFRYLRHPYIARMLVDSLQMAHLVEQHYVQLLQHGSLSQFTAALPVESPEQDLLLPHLLVFLLLQVDRNRHWLTPQQLIVAEQLEADLQTYFAQYEPPSRKPKGIRQRLKEAWQRAFQSQFNAPMPTH